MHRGATLVSHLGLSRVTSTSLTHQFPFIFNRRWKFKILQNPNNDRIIHDGRIVFTSIDRPKESARYHFGPSFGRDSVVYTKDNYGISCSLERLTNCRLDLASDSLLWSQQANFMKSELLCNLVMTLREWFLCFVDDTPPYEEAVAAHALDVTHPKYKLRKTALEFLQGNGMVLSHSFVKTCKSKMKEQEHAKPNKKTRNIGDLSCPASLPAGPIMSWFKHAIDRDYVTVVSGMSVTVRFFAEPSHSCLTLAFSKLMSPDTDYYFCVFSDDMCMSGPGIMANLDISSCDSSHGQQLFDKFFSIFNGVHPVAVEELRSQSLRPMVVTSSDGTQVIRMTPKYNVLYSGSTMTTSINTFASMNICLSIVAKCLSTPTIELIMLGARGVGYIVTVDICPSYHHLQFLKFSPVRNTDGIITPILNLGVICRTVGWSKDELPKRTKPVDFSRALVSGFVHAGNHALTDMLRLQYPCEGTRHTDRYHDLGCNLGYISNDELLRRYCVPESEFMHALWMFQTASLGDVVWSPAISRILEKDYGYCSGWTDGFWPQDFDCRRPQDDYLCALQSPLPPDGLAAHARV